MADLSVIIVNYNSGWFCANLVDSLLDQSFRTPAGEPGEIEIIVVDNASPDNQRLLLEPLKDRGVRGVYAEENTGYSGGNNLGMQFVTSDWLMISNPDVVLMPGSLGRMLEVLYRDPGVGLVGPRGWLDPGFHYYLPPVELPSAGNHFYETAGRIFKSVGRRYSLARSRYALRYWSGEGAGEADVISGYCFLMPTQLARKLGPFDPGFPFYYEDDDLCLRVIREGYRLLFVKDTRVVHFYNKSAGPVFDEVIEKYYRSKSYFFKKHYGPIRHFLYQACTRFLQKYVERLNGSRFETPVDLGRLEAPPSIDLENTEPMVVELTLDPAYVLAAGHRHPGGPYRMPESTWRVLDGTTWYLRFLDADCRRILRTFVFEKTTPAELPPPYRALKRVGS